MVKNNVDFIKNYFHQVKDIDAETVIESFCREIDRIPEHLNIFHIDMFMTPTLDGIIYAITLVSNKPSNEPIDTLDLYNVRRWAYEIFPDEDILSAKAMLISNNPNSNYIMQATLSITFND